MPDLPLHIAFVCSRLDQPGGIERACVNTANLFAGKGHQVTLLIADVTPHSFYPLHPSIKLVQAALFFGINADRSWISRQLSLIADVRQLRKIALQVSPDILIATEYPFAVAAVLAGLKPHMRLLSWEHFHFFELKKSSLWRWLVKRCYPLLHGVVVLNKDEQALYKSLNKNCLVIPNFIEPADILSQSLRRKRLLTIAHLSAQKKGFDLFPEVAQQVLTNNPDWEWKVIGKGEMEKSLLAFADKVELLGRLILQAPSSPNLQGEYADASLFVLTSRYECFPMTLLEAMRAGLPCVAFDCETGPRAIIKHGVNGWLAEAENPIALADALNELLHDKEKRNRMSASAAKSVAAFSPEIFYEKWLQLFRIL